MTDQATLDTAIDAALESGYRHFDCAELYENEELVGKALAKGLKKYGLQREDIFITSKIPPYKMDYEAAIECVKDSVKLLNQQEEDGDAYLDLYLIHWPTTIINEPGEANRLATWKALEEMKAAGFVRSIGVSNFTSKHLKHFLEKGIVPAVNQIEIHPLCQDLETVKLCQHHGIQLIAYAPLATSDDKLMNHPLIQSLSKKYQKQPGQIVLRWAMDRGFCAIPKSSKRDHVHANIAIGDFKLN